MTPEQLQAIINHCDNGDNCKYCREAIKNFIDVALKDAIAAKEAAERRAENAELKAKWRGISLDRAIETDVSQVARCAAMDENYRSALAERDRLSAELAERTEQLGRRQQDATAYAERNDTLRRENERLSAELAEAKTKLEGERRRLDDVCANLAEAKQDAGAYRETCDEWQRTCDMLREKLSAAVARAEAAEAGRTVQAARAREAIEENEFLRGVLDGEYDDAADPIATELKHAETAVAALPEWKRTVIARAKACRSQPLSEKPAISPIQRDFGIESDTNDYDTARRLNAAAMRLSAEKSTMTADRDSWKARADELQRMLNQAGKNFAETVELNRKLRAQLRDVAERQREACKTTVYSSGRLTWAETVEAVRKTPLVSTDAGERKQEPASLRYALSTNMVGLYGMRCASPKCTPAMLAETIAAWPEEETSENVMAAADAELEAHEAKIAELRAADDALMGQPLCKHCGEPQDMHASSIWCNYRVWHDARAFEPAPPQPKYDIAPAVHYACWVDGCVHPADRDGGSCFAHGAPPQPETPPAMSGAAVAPRDVVDAGVAGGSTRKPWDESMRRNCIPRPAQPRPAGWRTCEFCKASTNAKVRRCCRDGELADTAEPQPAASGTIDEWTVARCDEVRTWSPSRWPHPFVLLDVIKARNERVAELERMYVSRVAGFEKLSRWIEALRPEAARLRAKCARQRRELRRLNASYRRVAALSAANVAVVGDWSRASEKAGIRIRELEKENAELKRREAPHIAWDRGVAACLDAIAAHYAGKLRNNSTYHMAGCSVLGEYQPPEEQKK